MLASSIWGPGIVRPARGDAQWMIADCRLDEATAPRKLVVYTQRAGEGKLRLPFEPLDDGRALALPVADRLVADHLHCAVAVLVVVDAVRAGPDAAAWA